MRKTADKILFLITTLLVCVCANGVLLADKYGVPYAVFPILFLAANFLPLISFQKLSGGRMRVLNHGARCLKIFLISAVFSVAVNLVTAFRLIPDHWRYWGFCVLICFLLEAVLFWNGILCVYSTSVQLGIKLRVLGAVFGMVPIVHLYFLIKIIRTASDEVAFETEKYHRNLSRRPLCLCKTKYPLLLVHGVFFRDSKYFNYWGRIPKELSDNGAVIYYGEHQSAASVPDSAAELAERVRTIVKETGCGKLNIIAHSKGGLDCRYAIAHLGMGQHVASLTTVNTPHRGCKFADYLLNKIPKSVQDKVATAYNAALRRLGDENPDFLSAVRDLTSERGAQLDGTMPLPDGIYCQSIGSKLNHATGGKFPLNASYHLVKYFDGPNDGLVGEESFQWGESYTFLTTQGKRGISHGDVIDLNRENIPGFDVREWYVNMVSELKQRGL